VSKIIIVATGKSGTNVLYHIFEVAKELQPFRHIEDKWVFEKASVPDNHFCKCDTIYIKNNLSMVKFLHKNQDAHILWPTRHPNDLILSKITTPFYSRKPQNTPDDATIKGATESIIDSYNKYMYLKGSKRGDRVIDFKFEDLLGNARLFRKTIEGVCTKTSVAWDNRFFAYGLRFPDSVYRDKYKTGANLPYKWKTYKTLEYYDWLLKRGFTDEIVEGMFNEVKHVTEQWGYK
tara:strand:- start:12520 stop:13221 length:702 start_codon:yes stop_codon:yes gene_type:complete